MNQHKRAIRNAHRTETSRRPEETGPQDDTGPATPTALERHEDLEVLLDAEIAPLAHAIWESRGRPWSTDQEDWFEARRRLVEERGGRPSMTHGLATEQAREASESREAQEGGPSIRDRMVAIGRGNQQSGRQGS